MSPRSSSAILVSVAIFMALTSQAASSKRISLVSLSFRVPFALQVEGERTERVFGMRAAKCASYCPPVVMAWECGISSEPNCSGLNSLPPKDMCANASPETIDHSDALRETRWDCGKVTDSDGTSNVGFSTFETRGRRLVVSYLGGEADVSPAQFFNFVARSVRLR